MIEKRTSQKRYPHETVCPKSIRGILEVSGFPTSVPFVMRDVSSYGLGLWVKENLPLTATATLSLGAPIMRTLEARVVWCKDFHETNGLRAGLELKNSLEDFIESIAPTND